MVSERDMNEHNQKSPKPLVLSEGASVALGNVFKRINKPKPSHPTSSTTAKRPRPPPSSVVLTANEDVREVLRTRKQEKKRYKEARKAKLQFENNARVIPDAATNAAMEKQLLMTATKGAVALFNAVSKSQRAAEDTEDTPKKRRPTIGQDTFMNMMRAGVAKRDHLPVSQEEEDVSDPDQASRLPKSKAKWLKDDFLTARSRTLRDWDREAPDAYEVDPTGEEKDELGDSGTDESGSSSESDEAA